MFLGNLVEDGGADRRRRDAVDQNTRLCCFFCERFGQANDAGLGSGIGTGVGVAFLTRDGSNVDDAAVSLVHHVGNYALAADKHCVQIQVHHRPPFFIAVFPAFFRWSSNSGVTDKNVNPAHSGHGIVTPGSHLFRVSYIEAGAQQSIACVLVPLHGI